MMPEDLQIVRATESLAESFRAALDAVARERVFIEMLEAPSINEVIEFQRKQFAAGRPPMYAVVDEVRVVGWCDVTGIENPRQSHRGILGMGLLADFRGRGIGAKLLDATLTNARTTGIEKVELSVYTTNAAAIALYRKFGFTEEGLVRDYRRVDGRKFDCLRMAKFLH